MSMIYTIGLIKSPHFFGNSGGGPISQVSFALIGDCFQFCQTETNSMFACETILKYQS